MIKLTQEREITPYVCQPRYVRHLHTKRLATAVWVHKCNAFVAVAQIIELYYRCAIIVTLKPTEPLSSHANAPSN